MATMLKLTVPEGKHLTETDRAAVRFAIEEGEQKVSTARRNYTVTPLGDGQYDVLIQWRQRDDFGRMADRAYRATIGVA